MTFSRLLDIVRLDLAAVRRSRWLTFMAAIYAVLIGVFLLVGFRESSVLGFTGLGRVLLNFSHAIVLFLPLLAVTATARIVPEARDDGTFETLMTHPFTRADVFSGIAISRLLTLLVPLIVLSVLIATLGPLLTGEPPPWHYLTVLLGASSALIIAFTGIGLFISTHTDSASRTLIWALLAWATGVALMDFGLVAVLLQWRVEPATAFTLAIVNPVQCARFVLLASADPQLSTLGPVGFFLTNKLGSGYLQLLGFGWPLLLGLGTGWSAWRKFQSSDLV